MSPQNNIERRAARVLAAHEGIKYTEALRRVRGSKRNPSDIVRDPASVVTGGLSREEAIQKIADHIRSHHRRAANEVNPDLMAANAPELTTSVATGGWSREEEIKKITDYIRRCYRPATNEVNPDLMAANVPELTLSRYRDGALKEVAGEVDAHRKHVAAHPEDSRCGWSALTAVMEGRPDTYLWLLKSLAPASDAAHTVGILEGMTLDPRVASTFEDAVKKKGYLIGLTGIFRLIRGLQTTVPGEDKAETSRLLRYAPLTGSLRPRPALASSALTFFLLTIPEEEMADAIIESVIDRKSDDMAELVIALGWYEGQQARAYAEDAERLARSAMALCR